MMEIDEETSYGEEELKLPLEMWALVFSYLDVKHRAIVAQVSTTFHSVAWDSCEDLDLSQCAHLLTRRADCFLIRQETGLIYRCRNVKSLTLKGANSFTNGGFELMFNLPQFKKFLTQICLKSCGEVVNDRTLAAIANSIGPQLLSLNIEGCRKVTPAGMKNICMRCTNLEGLHIKGCFRLDNTLLQTDIATLTSLTDVTLSGIHKFLDSGIQAFSEKCTKLLRLEMQNCEGVTPAGYVHLAKNCRQIKELNIKGARLDETAVVEIGQNIASNLIHLELQLSTLTAITDDSIGNLALYATNLTRLNIIGCNLITDEGVEAIARNIGELRALELKGCYRITDRALKAMADMPKLAIINVDNCTEVTDWGIQQVTEKKGEIRQILNLANCNRLTNVSLYSIARFVGNNLLGLMISNCDLITDDGVKAIVDNCKERLLYLNVANCPLLIPSLLSYVTTNCSKVLKFNHTLSLEA